MIPWSYLKIIRLATTAKQEFDCISLPSSFPNIVCSVSKIAFMILVLLFKNKSDVTIDIRLIQLRPSQMEKYSSVSNKEIEAWRDPATLPQNPSNMPDYSREALPGSHPGQLKNQWEISIDFNNEYLCHQSPIIILLLSTLFSIFFINIQPILWFEILFSISGNQRICLRRDVS